MAYCTSLIDLLDRFFRTGNNKLRLFFYRLVSNVPSWLRFTASKMHTADRLDSIFNIFLDHGLMGIIRIRNEHIRKGQYRDS